MEYLSLYVTPKRKFSRDTSSSSLETSPVEKWAKESNSPDTRISDGEDEEMAALKLTEDFAEKSGLILARLCSLDTKMQELNNTVKSSQSKISLMEIDIVSVKGKQKNLDEKFTHMETNSTLVDEHLSKLQSSLYKSKGEIDECHKKILYLEAYSRRENLKFEGIAEASQHDATPSPSEETKDVLVDFLENVLGIEDTG